MTQTLTPILSPALETFTREFHARMGKEHAHSNRWLGYEAFKQAIFFGAETRQEESAAIRLYVELAKL